MFSPAKGGGGGVGPTKRGKGVKIMGIVDRRRLPLAASAHAANHHEVTLVQLTFDFYMIEAKPKNLIGEEVHDSDKLDEELRQRGIEMIAPHRTYRRRLRRSQRRWLVERFFPGFSGTAGSWFAGRYYAQNFLGFVQLACTLILLKQF